jgi:ribosomal protein L3 glutamine methyltransferase
VLKKRVIDRLPAPYITGVANFQGYQFHVDSRVIIPRSYIIELLNNGQFDQFIEHTELVHNILDLCTGNGSIAIAAANHFYGSEVVASDIDDAALEVAQINIEQYQLEDIITCIKSDLFTNLTKYKGKFDIIFTNPPYVDQTRMELLPIEYTHEPQLSLAGGASGLDFVDNILANAKDYLTDFGILVVEMGDNQQELEEKYPNLDFKWLPTNDGDGFIFVLTRADLNDF